MRLLLCPALLGILVCCGRGPSSSLKENVSERTSHELTNAEHPADIEGIFNRVSLNALKRIYASSATSGALSSKAAGVFLDSSKHQFGTYFFNIAERKAALRPYAIKATVSYIGKWQYDTANEQLHEVAVYAPGMMNWPELEIGDSVSIVVSRLGAPTWRTEYCASYAHGRSVLTIRLIDDRVAAYAVGQYAMATDSVLFGAVCAGL